ncbi:hypothetical protein A2U01_0034973, partial [Trifolium medium]|nr:hypothetical protein [Trifolium medium]
MLCVMNRFFEASNSFPCLYDMHINQGKGLLVFALFFLAATINAIVISLLMSLAAAGGFLA